MAHYVAQVSMRYTTGLPQDVVVNSFHFDAVQAQDSLTEIVDMVRNFYNEGDGQVLAIDQYLSSHISRDAAQAMIRIYDWGLPKPRPPLVEAELGLADAMHGNSLPLEVALCASYAAAPVAGIPRARMRGRIFLGPFIANANVSSPGEPGRPSANLISDIRDACIRLVTESSEEGLPKWSVYSRVNDELYQISHGWVDDEWDTQRRRQVKASQRLTWLLP